MFLRILMQLNKKKNETSLWPRWPASPWKTSNQPLVKHPVVELSQAAPEDRLAGGIGGGAGGPSADQRRRGRVFFAAADERLRWLGELDVAARRLRHRGDCDLYEILEIESDRTSAID